LKGGNYDDLAILQWRKCHRLSKYQGLTATEWNFRCSFGNYDIPRQYLNFNSTEYSSSFGITLPSDLWQTNLASYEESSSSPVWGLFFI